jgi:hypothetical protein
MSEEKRPSCNCEIYRGVPPINPYKANSQSNRRSRVILEGPGSGPAATMLRLADDDLDSETATLSSPPTWRASGTPLTRSGGEA